ncbi:MAG: hypothetical protein HY329_12045 [Chloroflexi bacterium]|nr:hypothetical protein [Chloroflexota bacterium]
MQVMKYDLKAFAADMDEIVQQYAGDNRRIVNETKPLYGRLISNLDWLDAKYRRPVENRSVSYLIHAHPDNLYTITSVVWWPGYSTPIHDHMVWGLVGMCEGEETEERYKRTDDGSRPNYCELRHVGTVVNAPGEICHLVPPDEDIHLIRNTGSTPSLSLHMYGGSLDGKLRHQFDKDTGEIKEFRSKYVVLC